MSLLYLAAYLLLAAVLVYAYRKIVSGVAELRISRKRGLMLEERTMDLQTLNNLREREVRHFESILDSFSDHIFRIATDGRFEFASRSALQLFQLQKKDVIGKQCRDIGLGAEVTGRLEEGMAYVLGNGRRWQGELGYLQGGEQHTYDCIVDPIFSADQSLISVCVSLRDITARKRAEVRLLLEQERFKLLLDGAQDHAIYMLDPEGKIISWNDAATRLTSYREDEVIGRHYSVFYSPEDIAASKPQEFLEQALVDGHSTGEGWRQRKDGTQFFASFVLTALRDPDGRLRGFSKVTRDITEKKRAEDALYRAYSEMEQRVRIRTEELHLSNERLQITQREYEELVNTVDGVVWEADVGKSGYTFISRQAERLLGYPIERWQGENGFWKAVMHPEDRARLSGEGYLSPMQKRDTQIEYRLITASGQTMWVRDYVRVFSEAGKPAKLRGIMVDITERKRAEVQLKRAEEEAVKASSVKSEFLANMSHEIRTPLNAIIGMAGIGLETTAPDEQRDCLTTIKCAGDSLLALINDILDFSKIEAGRVELEMSDFSLRELCRNALEVVKAPARAKGIRLDLDVADHLPDQWRGDSNRLLQILFNLLGNAVKFTPNSGQVTLRVKSGSRVRFEVADNGIGISKEAREKLFEPFTQADASTARKFGGTGLGLSICRRLVTLMGGTIGVESEPGVGSQFWVELKLEKSDAPLSAPSKEEVTALQSHSGKVKILVAEDNPANQKVIGRFLERLGCAYDVVSNGVEALTALQSAPYDLILMDCQMPEMDGYTATRKIREFEHSAKRPPVPIIALTAHVFSGDRKKCEQAGMDDYLTKPIRVDQLKSVLHSWIHRRDCIDLNYLKEMEMLQGPEESDLICEIIGIFLSEVPRKYLQVREALEGLDVGRLEKESHSVKSTCNNVGAKNLAGVFEEIETLARERKNEDLASRRAEFMERIESGVAAASVALKAISAERGKVLL